MVLNARSSLIAALVVALIAYATYNLFFKLEYSPIVQTSSGKVRGIVSKSRLGKSFLSFKGIPYGQPPLGKLRFSSPQPVKPWSGVHDAIHFASKCMQVDGLSRVVTGSEDCLHLNIFVSRKDLASEKLLPVIFYIHGGYFMVGSSEYMGPEFLMDEEDESILVTINYRLNVFGFLNTGDSAAKGNFGLKDQNLALKWVFDNIKQFNGDPHRITLAGQSAGSVAVHLHTLSPMSNGLFSGAIMSSGTSIKPWSLVNDPQEQAINLARQLNCPTGKSTELVQCLRDTKAFDILHVQLHALSSPIMDPLEIFAPSIETCTPSKDPDCFLSAHPYDILKAGGASRVPILTGILKDEGLLATGRMHVNASLKDYVSSNWNDLSPKFFRYENTATAGGEKELTRKIRNFYIGADDDDPNQILAFDEKFQNITNAFSDRLYIHASRETVKIQSQFSPVYLYYFTYPLYRGMSYFCDINPGLPIFPQFIWKEMIWVLNEYVFYRPNVFHGVGHGDDLVLIFKFPVFNLSPKSKDFSMSRQMVKLWIDFATNPKSLTFAGNLWPPVNDSTNLKYMLIGGDSNKNHGSLIEEEPIAQRMKFWDEINLPWKL